MMGEQRTRSRSPGAPARTGQAPAFRQPSAAARRCGGGSRSDTKLPPRTARTACADAIEARRADLTPQPPLRADLTPQPPLRADLTPQPPSPSVGMLALVP